MTRSESKVMTSKKIRTATSGKEIAEAMIAHFRTYTIPEMVVSEETEDPRENPVDAINAPLLAFYPINSRL